MKNTQRHFNKLSKSHHALYQIIKNESLEMVVISSQTLSGSLIQKSQYHQVIFSNCLFDCCEFQHTIFSNCIFENCTFQYTNLSDCTLNNCCFSDCILESSYLRKKPTTFHALKTLSLKDFLESHSSFHTGSYTVSLNSSQLFTSLRKHDAIKTKKGPHFETQIDHLSEILHDILLAS